MTDNRPYLRFDEIKAELTWRDIFKAFGILDTFKQTGDAFTGPCPLPQHQHGDHPNQQGFKADHRRGYGLYRCWGDCKDTPHGQGDVVNFVRAMTGLDNEHVRFWFAEHFGDRLTTKKPRQRPEKKQAKPVAAVKLPPEHPQPDQLEDELLHQYFDRWLPK